jgi:hypothetical protein
VDGDLANYDPNLDIDPATILNGIPKKHAPTLQMPEPLPPPLYVPERTVPLPPVNLDALSAAECAKVKADRQLKVKHLKSADQTVVSSALSRMGALLLAVGGFPDENTAWLLACTANNWASKKHGRHLKLTKGSEYLKLVSTILLISSNISIYSDFTLQLYERIPHMRTSLVSEKNRADVALSYELKAASSPAAIEANRTKVEQLLDGVNFVLAVRYSTLLSILALRFGILNLI